MKIKELLNPTDEQKFQRYIDKFRKNHIPKEYNQVNLMDELTNRDIFHYIDISNRTDGKTFNYLHLIINLSIDFEDLGFTFLSRKWNTRNSYKETIEEIVLQSEILEFKKLTFISTQYYLSVIYDGKIIGVISDLGQATELKYISNFMKQFPLIVYDEFIAIAGDYLPDEWNRMKTIYESIDRGQTIPYIWKPKILYLGNAENFESPILARLNLFKTLENHPMNTQKQYGKVMLGMYRNDHANEKRNTKAFDSMDDAMTTAEFKYNDFNLANDNLRTRIKEKEKNIYVKLYEQEYLNIKYHPETLETILAIVFNVEDYQFNLNLQDNKESSTYLKESFFSETHERRYVKDFYYKFDNAYSKDFITNSNNQLKELKINKIIQQYELNTKEKSEFEEREERYKENYIEQTLKGLSKRFWG